jgi:hypothetical protein
MFLTRVRGCPAGSDKIVTRCQSVKPLICQRDNRLYPPGHGTYNGFSLGYGAPLQAAAHTGSAQYC